MIIGAFELNIYALLLDKGRILPESHRADDALVSTARGNL
jgi:hypothetical protein